MSKRVVKNAVEILGRDSEWKGYDITFHLDNGIVSALQPNPAIFRTMTIGPSMYTEYVELGHMPLLTFFHECGHLDQWVQQGFPRTPNFLLNYLVLKQMSWERQAERNVKAIYERNHPTIRVMSIGTRALFKQPTKEELTALLARA